jgi:citronellol/citronellal dehydrogenase
VIAARRAEVLDAAADRLRADLAGRDANGSILEAASLDIRDRDAVEALADELQGRHGPIDILVNNAGGQFPHRARDLAPKGWRAVIDTNLTGTWNMTQVFGDQMLSGAGGAICQIVVVHGRGFPGLAHSAAARGGIIELTRTLAFEWGPNVRCNCVAPGPIRTAGFDAAYDPSIVKRIDTLPLQRYGTPRDVAEAVTFLVSPAASYITGEVLHVAGGQQLQGPLQALPRTEFPERAS